MTNYSNNQESKTQQNTQSVNMDLGVLFGILLDARWAIIMFTCIFVFFGVAYAMLMTPIYKADSLIQVEKKSGGGMSALVGDMGGAFTSESSSSTEIEIIKSRMTLGKTVDQLNLTTMVKPIYLPIIGKGLARITGKESHIAIGRFQLQKKSVGVTYRLIVDDAIKGLYSIYNEAKKEKVISGSVGELVERNGFKLFVQSLDAQNKANFLLSKSSRLNAIQVLQRNLTIRERGKNTGILQLSIIGENKQINKAILDDVGRNYFLQNVKRNFAEAEKSLSFLQGHLPGIKFKLSASEDKLNNFRQRNESIDLGMEAQSTLQVIVSLETRLNELTFEESEISKRFTKDHPVYRSLLDKRNILLERQEKLNGQVRKLPKTQRDILRMKRDVEVNQQIYIQLLNKTQELNVMKAGTVGNVRILDEAQSSQYAIKPKKTIIVILATILGLIIIVGLVIGRAVLHKGVENPDEIESLGIPVYASIPMSDLQVKMDNKVKAKNKYKKRNELHEVLLVESNPADLTVEALRGLRTSLHFAMMEAKNNVVMISGPAPGVGKSFVSVNFAAVIAKSGQKVLVVDADMRKGYLQRHFNLESNRGLSEMLSGKLEIEDLIKLSGIENLHVLTRGQIPPNPSELLMHPRFKRFIDWASSEYDLVLIDTPPVLAVTDPSIVGVLAGTTLMVGRFGKSTVKEVEVARQRFEMAGIDVKGFILNAVEKKSSSSYGYYNYNYESDRS